MRCFAPDSAFRWRFLSVQVRIAFLVHKADERKKEDKPVIGVVFS